MTKLLTAAFILAALPASAQDKLSIALDWTPNTNHVGLYVAEAQGWFKDAGLEVEILPYTDTSAGALIASGVLLCAALLGWWVASRAGRAEGADQPAL